MGAKRTVLKVMGMKGNLCRERVLEAIGRVAGVIEVSVSLIRARAEVIHGPACEPEALVRAVESAGFSASPEPAGETR